MMKCYSLCLLLMLLTGVVNAQQKIHYSSMNYVGLLEGERGSAFQLQTVQGIRKDQWFTGIGTGLDYYFVRSVPLFLSVNRTLLNKPRAPYLSLDGGLNFAWDRRQRAEWSGIVDSDFMPSLYWGAGVGYKIGVRNKRDALLLNIGYSFKHLKEEQQQATWCISPPCPPTTTERYDYKLNRVSVKVGWQL